MSKLFDNQS